MWQSEMKKIELHCHLDGSLSEKIVRELAEEAGIPCPVEKSEFLRMLQARPDCECLAEYLKAFEFPGRILNSPAALYRAAADVVKQAAAENVIYIEVRFAPLLHVSESMDCKTVIESVIEGLKEGSRQTGTRAAAILCGMRNHAPEDNIKMGRTGMEFLGDGVCGVDIAGDEAAYPVSVQKEFLSWAAKEKIPFTVHAGECGSWENIVEALELGAGRIGHGIAMVGKEDVMDLCRGKGIGIEMCPSSNLQTKAADSWEKYPFKEFYNKGLKISVNTDNRTVTGTTVTRELEVLAGHELVTEEVAKQTMLYALETSFASEEEKQELWKQLTFFNK